MGLCVWAQFGWLPACTRVMKTARLQNCMVQSCGRDAKKNITRININRRAGCREYSNADGRV